MMRMMFNQAREVNSVPSASEGGEPKVYVGWWSYLAREQYPCITGPSNACATLILSPSLAPTYEKLSGKQSNFAPAEAASFYKYKFQLIKL